MEQTIQSHPSEPLTTPEIPQRAKSDDPVSPEARAPENKKPGIFRRFEDRVRDHVRNQLLDAHRRRRNRSRTGSASSDASNRSQASQVSWDDDDEFDQVLKAMVGDLDTEGKRLEDAMPSFVDGVLGRSARSRYNDLKEELKQFRETVAGCFGMSDKERRMEAGSFSAEYRSLRGECYSELLDLRRAVNSDLWDLARAIRAEGPQPVKLALVRQKLENHNGTLSDIAKRMRPSRIEDAEVAVSSPPLCQIPTSQVEPVYIGP